MSTQVSKKKTVVLFSLCEIKYPVRSKRVVCAGGTDNGDDGGARMRQWVGLDGDEREMQMKVEGMKLVLEMADTLCLKTMREAVALLHPVQAMHFLFTAADQAPPRHAQHRAPQG